MTMIPAEMNGLLGSRICHDLISPLGAIGNGLELLEMTGQANSPEMELIADSVEAANARVRMFRLAFGTASPGQRTGWGELGPIVERLSHGRMQVEWTDRGDLDRMEARLCLLLLLCAETLLPFGGTVRIEPGPPALVTLQAERMREDDDLLRQLVDPEAPLPLASDLHFALARYAAVALNRHITVVPQSGGLQFVA